MMIAKFKRIRWLEDDLKHLKEEFGRNRQLEYHFYPIIVKWIKRKRPRNMAFIGIFLNARARTSNFALVLTPVQMFVFAFVVMVYIPCITTIAVLVKEFGIKKASIITLAQIGLAISLGGVIFHTLKFIGFP